MERIMEMRRSIRVRYAAVIFLLLLCIWWGTVAFERYWSQPLTTDISQNFGDSFGFENGIQFPITTFCQYWIISSYALLKECSNGSWGLFPSIANCLKDDKDFNIDSFMSSVVIERQLIIKETQLWTGSSTINLKHVEKSLWSKMFHHHYGLCHSFDLSNIKASLYMIG